MTSEGHGEARWFTPGAFAAPMVRDSRRGALLTMRAALVAVLAVLPVVADMFDRHHVFVLRISWPLSVTSMI